MVIDDGNVAGVAVVPDETQPVLVVDADAVLALPITRQLLKPIGGRTPQVV